jgi:hypothetical protein
MPSGTAGKIYARARRRAGLAHGSGIHTLRHCFAPISWTPVLIRAPCTASWATARSRLPPGLSM